MKWSISAGASVEVAITSRSRNVSRRRRAEPASETLIAAGCARSSSTSSSSTGQAAAEQPPRLARVLAAPPPSALRIFSSLFAPSPASERSRSCSAASFSSASVVTPSSFQIRRAVFGPRPGSRMNLTTSSGTSFLRFVSASISPSSTIWTILSSIVLPIPEQALRLPLERELRDRAARLADPRRRAAVGEDAEGVLALELAQVGQQLELVGELVVPRQGGRPPTAMIRR